MKTKGINRQNNNNNNKNVLKGLFSPFIMRMKEIHYLLFLMCYILKLCRKRKIFLIDSSP